MEGSRDFLQLLKPDLAVTILSSLDDPADIVRVSSVSRYWRQFVIANGFSKNLCLRLFPEVSRATCEIEENVMIEATHNNNVEVENLKRSHRMYALLAQGLSPTLRKDCILEAISASSTVNQERGIQKTLEPWASFWCSEGKSDPELPESLTYKLTSKLCFITEINIVQAFSSGFPICPAKAMRFRVGHLKEQELHRDLVDELGEGLGSSDDDKIWTYISPKFPMHQGNWLHKFELPQPVLGIGGILQIELLGRFHRDEIDGLFHIRVCHVQVAGRPLSPAFDAELVDLSRKCVLNYCPKATKSNSSTRAAWEDKSGAPSRVHSFTLQDDGRELDPGDIPPDTIELPTGDGSTEVLPILSLPENEVLRIRLPHDVPQIVVYHLYGEMLRMAWRLRGSIVQKRLDQLEELQQLEETKRNLLEEKKYLLQQLDQLKKRKFS